MILLSFRLLTLLFLGGFDQSKNVEKEVVHRGRYNSNKCIIVCLTM